jgi:hypothetical protein
MNYNEKHGYFRFILIFAICRFNLSLFNEMSLFKRYIWILFSFIFSNSFSGNRR